MFVLILIVTANTHVSVTATDFEDSAACLKAISTALDLEDREVKIKAKCVAK
jgi:hypothetical protein